MGGRGPHIPRGVLWPRQARLRSSAAGRQAGGRAGSDQASVQARVLGGTPVQVDLEGLLFAGRVADPVARLQQTAALSLQQLAPLVLGQIHGLLSAVPVKHNGRRLPSAGGPRRYALALGVERTGGGGGGRTFLQVVSHGPGAVHVEALCKDAQLLFVFLCLSLGDLGGGEGRTWFVTGTPALLLLYMYLDVNLNLSMSMTESSLSQPWSSGTPCPACFPLPTHLVQMNGSLSGFC